MRVSIMIPYREGGCEWRKKALPHVVDAYRRALPDVPIEQVDDLPAERFSRARARNMAVEKAGDGIVVLADADILPCGRALLAAVKAARRGGMHLPYDYYRSLNRASTLKFYANTNLDPVSLPMDYDSYTSTAGIIVIRCDEWHRAGGMDERIRGWGWEDTAFACAARVMLGEVTRHKGTINHLWHPFAGEIGSEEYKRNKSFYDMCAAVKTKREMRGVIDNADRRVRP